MPLSCPLSRCRTVPEPLPPPHLHKCAGEALAPQVLPHSELGNVSHKAVGGVDQVSHHLYPSLAKSASEYTFSI